VNANVQNNIQGILGNVLINVPVQNPPVQAAQGLNQEIAKISHGSFILSGAAFKNKAVCLGIVAGVVILISPGLHALKNGKIVANGVWDATKKVLNYSFKNSFPLFSAAARKESGGLALSAFKTVGSFTLYNTLMVKPYCSSYSEWRISRMQELSRNNQIPEIYHEDEVLRENICAITLSPIRFPVRDQYGHIWEQAVIIAWLEDHDTSPLNRRPLHISDLVFQEDLFNRIGERLQQLGHQE
jgi:hypothetical protein